MSQTTADLIAALTAELGPAGVLVGDAIGERYVADRTRVSAHRPVAVMRPSSTAEVAAALRLCNAASQPVVTQGGLTGLAGGATPHAGEFALSLERMSGVESIDPDAGTARVLAGTPLASIHEAVAPHGLQFSLDLGSRGSCNIGGNISTNAGGNRVIRYGMTRDLVLGVEAVLADGTVISALNAMMKNNAGYDLKHLFIGTEGTLGVVTRAVLRLHPAPRERLTALLAIPSFGSLVGLLRAVRKGLGGQLGSFEVMWPGYYEFAVTRVLTGPRPFEERHPLYAIVEMETLDPVADRERLESLLAEFITQGLANDCIVAASLAESARIWRIRECADELMRQVQPVTAYDISMPIGAMEDFLAEVERRAAPHLGEWPLFNFGHLGDGNLHIIAGPRDEASMAAVDAAVYGALTGVNSVSAEHGIGMLKRAYLPKSRTPEELALMRTLKRTLDPRNILNPGRVL